jgi:hypothetical protein
MHRLSLALLVALCLPTLAQESPAPAPSAPIYTTIHPRVRLSAVDGNFKRLPDSPDGKRRYDITSFLITGGTLTPGVGKRAILLEDEETLVLTATGDEQRQSASYLEDLCCGSGAIKQIELGVTAWSYLDDPATLAKNVAATFEDIQKRAGDTLQPLDAHLLLTRSGNCAVSTQLLAVEGKPAAVPDADFRKAPALNNPGSFVSIEPVIGPDGSSLDFQLSYCARIPQAGSPDLYLSHATNCTLIDGSSLVVHSILLPPLPDQNPKKARRCVVVVSGRILSDPTAETLAKKWEAEREERKQRLIKQATDGLPSIPGEEAAKNPEKKSPPGIPPVSFPVR